MYTKEGKRISQKRSAGFTLIESLVYAVGMVLLLLVITTLLVYFYDWYSRATAPSRADRVGIALVDRIVKDVRTGLSINLTQSALETPVGSLFIDAIENETSVTKFFNVSNGRVMYSKSGTDPVFLSPTPLSISRFHFTQISFGISQAIRIEIEITYQTRNGLETRTYTGLAILRHSYD